MNSIVTWVVAAAMLLFGGPTPVTHTAAQAAAAASAGSNSSVASTSIAPTPVAVTPPVPVQAPLAATATVQQNQPTRVVSYAAYSLPTGYVSSTTLNLALANLRTDLLAHINSTSASNQAAQIPQQVAANGFYAMYNVAPISPAVNSLSNVTITNPTITGLSASAIPDLSGQYLSLSGGTVSGATALATTTVSGNLTVSGSIIGNISTATSSAINFNAISLIATNATSTNLYATNLAAANASFATALGATSGGTGISNPSAAGILLGNYTGTGWQQLATSTLGLLTTSVAEGSNLYFTNARVDARINATSTIGTLISAPNLTTIGTISSLIATNATSTTLFASLGHFATGVIDSLTAATANITNLIATSITGTNATFANATTTNATSTNLYATNLAAANASFANATTTNFATLATSYFGGNVGIGTTTPFTNFAVNGSGYFSNSLTAQLQDAGGQVFNVKAYGAKGDGTTNDTAAINAAVTAAYNAGGGTVVFSPGKYVLGRRISNQQQIGGIWMLPGVNFEGNGATLLLRDNTEFFMGTGTGSTTISSNVTQNIMGSTTAITVANGAIFAVGNTIYYQLGQDTQDSNESSYFGFANISAINGNVITIDRTINPNLNLASITNPGKAAVYLISNPIENVKIDNFYLYNDIANGGNAEEGIQLDFASGVNISNIRASNPGAAAVNGQYTENIKVTNLNVDSSIAQNGQTSKGRAISFSESKDIDIADCNASNLANVFAYFEFHTRNVHMSNINIVNTQPESSYPYIFGAQQDSQVAIDGVKISGNGNFNLITTASTSTTITVRNLEVETDTDPWSLPAPGTQMTGTLRLIVGTSTNEIYNLDSGQMVQRVINLQNNQYTNYYLTPGITANIQVYIPSSVVPGTDLTTFYIGRTGNNGSSFLSQLVPGQQVQLTGALGNVGSVEGLVWGQRNANLKLLVGTAATGSVGKYIIVKALVFPSFPGSVTLGSTDTVSYPDNLSALANTEVMTFATTTPTSIPFFSDANTLVGSGIYWDNTHNFLGVGTSTPSSRLTVWGSDTASTSALTVINNAGTTEFSVYDTGNAVLAGGLTQNSDQRLKTNISSLDASSSLAAINALSPVTFNWIDPDKGSVPQYGFIAQDVQKVFPNLVSVTAPTSLTPDGTLSLNYIDLISPIVKAIQALSTELASIENRLSGFERSISTLLLNAQEADVQKLCVGTTCVTPAQFQAMVAAAGQSGTVPTSATAPATSSSTPPVIQIAGTNPAVVHVGDTYVDLGATITAPDADKNLGILTYLNGVQQSQITIDTSTTATDTIDYVVSDQFGITATSTRTVIVQ